MIARPLSEPGVPPPYPVRTIEQFQAATGLRDRLSNIHPDRSYVVQQAADGRAWTVWRVL